MQQTRAGHLVESTGETTDTLDPDDALRQHPFARGVVVALAMSTAVWLVLLLVVMTLLS